MSKKIYTKTGDKGTTSLLGGTKVSKDDWRLEAYGTVDELNSFIGLLWDSLFNVRDSVKSSEQLEKIQNNLFIVGSCLSYDSLGKDKIKIKEISDLDISELENWIDEMDTELPELKNFILPRGSQSISLCHVCRTISRRAERRCVPSTQYPLILKYINRLSDYFFVLARFINKKQGFSEVIWKS